MASPSRQREQVSDLFGSLLFFLFRILALAMATESPFADGISGSSQGALPLKTGADRAAQRGGGVSRAAAQLSEAAGIQSHRSENSEADKTCGFRDVHDWSYLDGAKRRGVGGARQLRGKAGMALGPRARASASLGLYSSI